MSLTDVLVIQDKHYIMKNYPQIARANLSIRYREQGGKCYFTCDIFSQLFPEYLSASLLSRFFNFLDKLLENPSMLLSTIDLTLTEEKKLLLCDFNDTDVYYPLDKTLIDLFDAIVSQYPNKIAVKAFNGELTYYELNNKAESLASFLIEKGVRTDNIIGILIDNRLEMIIAVMAVLKSGAAYLPITHNTPVGLIDYILNDSDIKFLLTLPHLAAGINASTIKIDINKEIPNFLSTPSL